MPPGPTPLWRPGGEWSDMCGFLKPLGSDTEWQVRVRLYHPRQHAGSQVKGSKLPPQVWVHLSHVNARLVDRAEGKNFAIRPQQGKKADSFNSDHSLVVQVIHMTSCASISNGRSSSNAPLMSRFSPSDRMRNERPPLCPVCCHSCRDQHEISAGKKQNINPMWKVLVKEVNLGEPTSFLDHVYFGCTMRPEINSNDFGVFGINLQIRIRISSSRKLYFLNDSNFWCVQSSITHHVAVHVPVLWPVCSHTIPFRMLWLP